MCADECMHAHQARDSVEAAQRRAGADRGGVGKEYGSGGERQREEAELQAGGQNARRLYYTILCIDYMMHTYIWHRSYDTYVTRMRRNLQV